MPALACIELNPSSEEQLRNLVCHVLQQGTQDLVLNIPDWSWESELLQPAATFVTLYWQKQLMGCIGISEPIQPLWRDVAEHAFASAFNDRRFSVLTKNHLVDVEFTISILSEMKSVSVSGQQELIAKLKAEHFGVMLQHHRRTAMFLPSVWKQMTSEKEFVSALLHKGGWPEDFWEPTMRVSFFSTYCIAGEYQPISL